MNQITELVVLGILLAVLVLKPRNVTAYIKSHLGRLVMVAILIYLTMRNYLYGVIALALIVLIHEMRVIEGNENMTDSAEKKKIKHDDDEEEADDQEEDVDDMEDNTDDDDALDD